MFNAFVKIFTQIRATSAASFRFTTQNFIMHKLRNFTFTENQDLNL